MSNPLLATWDTPFEFPPFDKVSDQDIEPAIDAALEEARTNTAAIASQTSAPSFENTIEALEQSDETLGRVLSTFYSLAGADANDARMALQRKYAPVLAEFSTELYMNVPLFARIQTLWDERETLGLAGEQSRVLMLYHRRFVRAGAALEGSARDELAGVNKRLAVLGTQFTQNLLADEGNWFYELGEDDLEGLPDFVIAAARAAGEDRGSDGPVITLSRSLIVPFLQFSTRRDLREISYRAWTARGANGGETDNRDIARETLSLRQDRARLLGYGSFADFKLETEMAKTPDAVRGLLMDVWEPAKAQANLDSEILEEMMRSEGVNGPLEPWDWRFYSEKRRKIEHDLDEAELKPYLQLDRMIQAAFDCATRLFGLEFRSVDLPVYHPDCRTWEVTRDGEHVAVFLGDYFARASKRSGAWCSAMRSQRKLGQATAPIVVNVCNFAKPASGSPALLSYDDARTLFHEFGHALHQMLSDVTYETVSGTSVARDFVELPSQLYEHWLEVPEVLQKYATHADTGAPMPTELLERVLAAATYDMGFQAVEYVASALVDLAFHEEGAPEDPIAKEAEVLDRIGMPAAIGMRHATPHFAHVFAGDGYSSGYYSYMWSEVMDADAFAAFEEADGAFDPEMAKRLEEFILSKGGSQDAEELYLAFRGKLPGVEALLKGRGLTA